MGSRETEEIKDVKDLFVNFRAILGRSTFSDKASLPLPEFRRISLEINSCATAEPQSINTPYLQEVN